MTDLYLLRNSLLSASEAATELTSLLPKTDIVLDLEEILIQQFGILVAIQEGESECFDEDYLNDYNDKCKKIIDFVEKLKLHTLNTEKS